MRNPEKPVSIVVVSMVLRLFPQGLNEAQEHTNTHTRQESILHWIGQELNPQTCNMDMYVYIYI